MSTSYPSPSPASPSPTFPGPSAPAMSPTPSQQDDTRRRSKRDSATRREEAATRYPSPPPQPSQARATRASIEASLVIPPFRGAKPAPASSPVVPSSPSMSAVTPGGYSTRSGARPVSAMPVPQQQHYSSSQQQQQQQQQQGSQQGYLASSPPVAQSARGGSRASVGYLPTQSASSAAANLGPYPDIYRPHQMPRQKIYFGPYILLQTLGEGEFGKVKLGLHSERWGEEVAIKLIKRGSVDTMQRSEKVKREIDVLKTARHPNIVSLYDVIETDKYIGIVLEFCSGGELFDHILAHRYLREKDATRLFSQLVSGVAYLHAKGIVHRDLKLENLLLERGFLKITDFGFANRFTSASVDLMATSCGSPCYAAPELVVQEGKYVGTAVDVWSCGVILYAMLAGYLPYDDDPANPEGDNINLLYKYIINTPLTFPEWITPEPRDLLLRMLVPDPLQRCTIDEVTRHPWLRKHVGLFMKTVPELERQAHEQEMGKRQALEAQRQFLVNQQQQQLLHQQQQQQILSQSTPAGYRPHPGQAMSRSQTAYLEPLSTSQSRHRSAVVQSTSTSASLSSSTSHGAPSTSSQRHPTIPEQSQPVLPHSITEEAPMSSSPPSGSRPPSFVGPSGKQRQATTQMHAVSVQSVPMIPSFSAPPDPPAASEDQVMSDDSPAAVWEEKESGSASRKRKQQNRATLQVEYAPAVQERKSENGSASSRSRKSSAATTTAVETPKQEEDVVMTPIERAQTPMMEEENANAASEPTPARPSTPPLVPLQLPVTPPQTPLISDGNHDSNGAVNTPQKRRNSGSPTVTDSLSSTEAFSKVEEESPVKAPPREASSSSTTPIATPSIIPAASNTPLPHLSSVIPPSRQQSPAESDRAPSVASNTTSASRHKKGGLSTDRFSIRSLLGSSTSSSQLERSTSTTRAAKAAAVASAEASKRAEAAEKQKALDEVTNNRRKSRRQKALSLQPFRPSTAAKVAKALQPHPDLPVASTSTAREGPRTRSSTGAASPTAATQEFLRREGAMAPPPARSSGSVNKPPVPPRSTSMMGNEAEWSAAAAGGTPSGKAKAVMDWFRRRGTAKGAPVETPFSTDFDRSRRQPSTATTATTRTTATAAPPATSSSMSRGPSVVVTSSPVPESPEVGTSVPSSRSPSGAQSDLSYSSHATTSTVGTTPAGSVLHAPAPASVAPTKMPSSSSVSTVTPPFSESRLRIHNGALDKSALFQKKMPAEVIAEVRQALWNMGIEMVVDGDFKIKCVRQSRKKMLANAGAGLGVSNLSSSQSSYGGLSSMALGNSGSDRRPGIPSSPSFSLSTSPSMGFRSFFSSSSSSARKAGATTPNLGSPAQFSAFPSPALSSAAQEEMDVLGSPLAQSSSTFAAVSQHLAQPAPMFGDANSTDQGDEVRFNCEITRVKNLAGLYYVDVKRLKGSPWSYKHIYDSLLSQIKLDA